MRGASGRCLVGAARQPLEQAHAELLLQCVQPAERRRVIDAKLTGRSGEAARALHRQHEAQVIPIIHALF
jgi:hypothetical protein